MKTDTKTTFPYQTISRPVIRREDLATLRPVVKTRSERRSVRIGRFVWIPKEAK